MHRRAMRPEGCVAVGSAQVKEEPAQRAGDTEQNSLPRSRPDVLPARAISDSLKHHIPHAMAQLDATVLKLGQRAVVRLGRVAGQLGVGDQ